MSHPRFEIVGDADGREAAAIAAVVIHLGEEAAKAVAVPSRSPRLGAWVQAWHLRESVERLPAHTYDASP